jgi:hypothetical protein
MERWWCIDCGTAVSLNMQARCEQCDSDAVDTMERLARRSAATSTHLAVDTAQVILVPAQLGTSYPPWYLGVEQIAIQVSHKLNELTERSRLN